MATKANWKVVAAMLLVLSSILLATYQVLVIDDIADGTLIYIAQALMFAGAALGIDTYVQKIMKANEKE